MPRTIGKRYARALYAAAGQPQAREALDKELAAFAALFETQPQLRQTLRNPGLPAATKIELIQSAFNGSDLLKRFLSLLVTRGRIDLLPQIRAAYERIVLEAKGIEPVLLITSHPLRPELVDRMRQRISERIGKTAQLKIQIDPSVLGGVKLKYGDREIDDTLKSKLNQLSKLLSE